MFVSVKDDANIYIQGSILNRLIKNKWLVLASHMCSHKGFALSDLYVRRPERIEKYSKRFGKLEVSYLGEDGMKY